MITWLQDTFGKHHRMLLGALLVVIIGSFVFYGAAGSGSGGHAAVGELRHTTPAGVINLTDARATREARELAAFRSFAATPDDFLRAAQIAAIRQTDETDPQGDRLFAYLVDTVNRLGAADAMGLPRPDEKQLADFIRKHRYFAGANGEFDPAALKRATEMAHDRLNLDEARFQGALANEWRISRLAAAAQPDDAPALDILAARVSEMLRAKWTVGCASYARTDYTTEVTRDPAAIAAHYETVKESHRVPKRLKLRYARIPGAPLDTAAKPADEELIATAERRRDRFPLVGTVSNATFILDNRAALEALWREEKSGEAAAAAASESLAKTMPLGNARPDNAALDAMIAAAGLKPVALPAYGTDCVPKVAELPEALLAGALNLSATTWRTAAIPYGDAAYVFIFDEETPSRIPALDEVRPAVEAAWVKLETDRLFIKAANAKAAEIAAAVKAGKPFAAAAAEAGFKPVDIPTFDRRTPPEKLAAHMELLQRTPVGSVSPALAADADRLVVHIAARAAAPAEKTDTTAEAYRRLLGTAAARSTAESLSGIAD